jgi:hypothetical protein
MAPSKKPPLISVRLRPSNLSLETSLHSVNNLLDNLLLDACVELTFRLLTALTKRPTGWPELELS